MNIVFFGTPELSAFVLEKLCSDGFSIKAVVTQPDRKSGRGQHLTPPPVKEMALQLGLNVIQSERFDRKLFSEISKLGDIDMCVVVAYGCYIPTYFIDHMKGKMLNIHFSLLPKYRGAAPVARSIMNGDIETGVTIMKIFNEMDTGDIVSQAKLPISMDENTESLSWKLVEMGTKLLLDTIVPYSKGAIETTPQSNVNITPTYASKISAEEKIINWDNEAITIHNQIRALYPWPVAESKIEEVVIKFLKTSVLDNNTEVTGQEPGVITDADPKKGVLAIATGKGVLLVEKVKPSGKKEMDITDFLNGYALKKGMRFSNV